jgi:hypothetical protein
MIAMILIMSANFGKFKIWQKRSSGQWLIFVWLVCVLTLLPSSPMRELYASIPDNQYRVIRSELIEFDQFSKGESIAVQTSLGPQFNRTNILAITQDSNGNCAPMRRDPLVAETKYLVFANKLNHYLINDLEQCLKRMNLSNDFEKLTEYKHLQIYKLIYSKK